MSRGNRTCRTCRTRILARRSRVSGSWNLEKETTHGQTGSTTPQHADRRPTNQIAWQAELGSRRHARHVQHPRSILASMSGMSARTSRGCYEETAAVEFQPNSVLSGIFRRAYIGTYGVGGTTRHDTASRRVGRHRAEI